MMRCFQIHYGLQEIRIGIRSDGKWRNIVFGVFIMEKYIIYTKSKGNCGKNLQSTNEKFGGNKNSILQYNSGRK